MMNKQQAEAAYLRARDAFGKRYALTGLELERQFFDSDEGKELYAAAKYAEVRREQVQKQELAGGTGRMMDEMAHLEQREGESWHQAYARAFDSPEGRAAYRKYREARYSQMPQVANGRRRFELGAMAIQKSEGLSYEKAARRLAQADSSGYAAYLLAGGERIPGLWDRD
jgi:hypothetical protein